jgi:circadian clock protein KaiC
LAASGVAEVAAKLNQVRLDAEEIELEMRLKSLQTELAAKRLEKALLVKTRQTHQGELLRGRAQMKEMRGDDATIADEKSGAL